MRAMYLVSRAAMPHLRRAGGRHRQHRLGVGLPGSVERPSHAYAASKGAVLALTRAMAASYGRDGIRVNAICPGTIRTRLTADIVERMERAAKDGHGIPLGRVGEPEDIARCALFLASDDASFVSGADLVADGGAMAATIACPDSDMCRQTPGGAGGPPAGHAEPRPVPALLGASEIGGFRSGDSKEYGPTGRAPGPARRREWIECVTSPLVEEDAAVDVEDLPGDAVRAAERHDLIGHVLHARRPPEDGALPRALGHLGPEPRGHPRSLHEPGGHAVHGHLWRQGHRQAAREMDEPRLARRVGDAAPAGVEPGHRGDVDDATGAARLEVRGGRAARR